MDYQGFLDTLRRERRPSPIVRQVPNGEFPEVIVQVPEHWPHIVLAPLFDVHIGAKEHDATLFAKHLAWLRRTPYVLTFNGGDMIENASKLSVGAGVYAQEIDPQSQLIAAMRQLNTVAHRMLFALPGNHEARTDLMGVQVGQWLAMALGIPYFPDYAMCYLKWRGNTFRLLAHHGSGASVTAGAQRMAARKDISWARPFDLFWTGHLHNPLVDILYQTDRNDAGRLVERNALVIISPSYLGFFGSYGATKRYHPGTRGLAVVTLQEDGRIDASVHARGERR